MGAYVPNPIAVVALKSVLYGAYGWLELYFHPRGGKRALLKWSLGGLALSTATDALILFWFPEVPALRFGWC